MKSSIKQIIVVVTVLLPFLGHTQCPVQSFADDINKIEDFVDENGTDAWVVLFKSGAEHSIRQNNNNLSFVNDYLNTSLKSTDEVVVEINAVQGFDKWIRVIKHQRLQIKFDQLVESDLLPKYKKLDPDLKAGYTGSFKTGKVGNPTKPTFGEPINLDSFDIDFWIESDALFAKFGSNLRADVEFRKLLSETPGFEGLKPNKKGFSIKFKLSK